MSRDSKFCCPTCGHPVLPKDPLAFLSMMERAIFDTIYRAGQAGITRTAIWERVYAPHRDSTRGEGDPRSVISIHIRNANQKLRWLHMEITTSRGTGRGSGRDATYWVRRMPQDLAQRHKGRRPKPASEFLRSDFSSPDDNIPDFTCGS